MARYRGKSHRQDTYEETSRDQIQELRAIVRKQHKMIKQLRKELQKREDVSDDYAALVNEMESSLQPPKKKVREKACPECKGNLKDVTIGTFEIVVCNECGYRKRLKS